MQRFPHWQALGVGRIPIEIVLEWSELPAILVAAATCKPRASKLKTNEDGEYPMQALRKSTIIEAHEGPNFSDAVINDIANSLPEPLSKRRSELLPKILREWNSTDLREHLSMESRPFIHARIKKLVSVGKRAQRLLEALDATDELGRLIIKRQMIQADGLTLETASRPEHLTLAARFDDWTAFLTNLARIKPKEIWNLKAGQPPNLAAYFVLKDAAAIFEWFTGLKATREVDRYSLKDTGPFWRFASVLWPVVFEKGVEGLSSALKNWAQDTAQFDERSALIANIAMRNSTWGVFET